MSKQALNYGMKSPIFMTGWTPLFQQIIGSSVWNAKDHVRITWITLLATADKRGVSPVTAGGLAILARLTPELTKHALKVLSEPDDDTLTQEYEGRRIERVEDGWRLLNWDKYRDKAKRIVLAEQNREAQARFRAKTGNRPENVEEVIENGSMFGVTEAECRKFWDYYEGCSRRDENGETVWVVGKEGEKPIGKWQSVLKQWGENARARVTEESQRPARVRTREAFQSEANNKPETLKSVVKTV